MPSGLDSFGERLGSPLALSLCDFFHAFGGRKIRALKLLPRRESERLRENWLRYGFCGEKAYVPIAEDENGDLFCVACASQWCGQVFHVPWAGEEAVRFGSLQEFVAACTNGES